MYKRWDDNEVIDDVLFCFCLRKKNKNTEPEFAHSAGRPSNRVRESTRANCYHMFSEDVEPNVFHVLTFKHDLRRVGEFPNFSRSTFVSSFFSWIITHRRKSGVTLRNQPGSSLLIEVVVEGDTGLVSGIGGRGPVDRDNVRLLLWEACTPTGPLITEVA